MMRLVFVGGVMYLLFGVCFGWARGVGEADGDLFFFCRLCRDYGADDVLLMKDGEVRGYGNGQGGLVAGKILAKIKIRNLYDENNK